MFLKVGKQKDAPAMGAGALVCHQHTRNGSVGRAERALTTIKFGRRTLRLRRWLLRPLVENAFVIVRGGVQQRRSPVVFVAASRSIAMAAFRAAAANSLGRLLLERHAAKLVGIVHDQPDEQSAIKAAIAQRGRLIEQRRD